MIESQSSCNIPTAKSLAAALVMVLHSCCCRTAAAPLLTSMHGHCLSAQQLDGRAAGALVLTVVALCKDTAAAAASGGWLRIAPATARRLASDDSYRGTQPDDPSAARRTNHAREQRIETGSVYGLCSIPA